jgi:hypothetical protein
LIQEERYQGKRACGKRQRNNNNNNNNNNNKSIITRLCQQFDETIDHIITACPILTKEQYIEMTECVLKYKERGGKLDNEHWYEHVPKLVETSHESEVNILQINKY